MGTIKGIFISEDVMVVYRGEEKILYRREGKLLGVLDI